MTKLDYNVREKGMEIMKHMTVITHMFKPGAEVTVLVRRPGKPDQDFLITNDDLDEIIAAIERSKKRPGE